MLRALSLVTLLGLLAAAPASVLAEGQHTMQNGETLSEIADTYAVPLDELLMANSIHDANLVIAGTVLDIPSGETTAADTGASYRVQVGDTLSAVAGLFGIGVGDLADANALNDPNLIVAGDELYIPSSYQVVTQDEPGSAAWAEPGDVSALIDAHAQAAGIDPTLVRALAWQESGWQQHVVSSAGAVGVMQLLPGTADWIGSYLLEDELDYWGSTSDNVAGGVAYLSHLLALSDWDVQTALAAYYQGWASVQSNGIYDDSWAYIDNVLAIQSWFW